MIATCGAPVDRLSVEHRGRFLSGIRIASKNRGDTMRMSPHGPFWPGGTISPSIVKLAVDQPPPNGITDVTPAAFTPAIALSRGCSWFVERESARCRVRYFTARQVEVEHQHVVRIEPGIDALQPRHALDQQPRADEQRERQRDLGDDEPAAHVAPGEIRRAAAAAVLERFLKIRRATSAAPARARTAARSTIDTSRA